MSAIHPNDVDRVRAAWETAVTHQSHYNTDYRLRCADGIYRWFNARGVPMLGADGSVLKWFGVILSIAGSARMARSEVDLRPARADQFEEITPGALRAARASGLACGETCRDGGSVPLYHSQTGEWRGDDQPAARQHQENPQRTGPAKHSMRWAGRCD
ncbi:hypothetical protein J2Y58_003689 [Sphingomonas sp. BE138]|nr:PAS domain-containing protein [Sphingomonas sp. BE138]MDR6790309.1 hypothetical protein [Sphingomonas sp. BE138]